MDKDNKHHNIVSVSIGQIDMTGDHQKPESPDPESLPLLPTRDLVLFPGITFPITLGRPSSLETARCANERNRLIGLVCQKDASVEQPSLSDLYEYGVTVEVLKIFDLPDGTTTSLVRAIDKIRILGPAVSVPEGFPESQLAASVRIMHEPRTRKTDLEFCALVRGIRKTVASMIEQGGKEAEDVTLNFDSQTDGVTVINLTCTQVPLPSEIKQELLAVGRPKQRGFRLLAELSRTRHLLALSHEIHERTSQALTEQQRNAFLQQQMESIRRELYGDDDDATVLRHRAASMTLPEHVARAFSREIEKLGRLNPQSPDYSVQYSYLDSVLSLPWHIIDPVSSDIAKAREILEEDHYGLQRVKERIIEQLAVLINNPDGRACTLCFVGPPGVGKTSLGRSIAKALGRRYQRVALGGLHDEAEIRGHRRTYIGAMSGRIIDAIRRSGSSNPVLLLDEIDKIASDFKGDPSAALLEVLDPEQNCRFHDNYIDLDFDLSKVLFIATANTLSTIAPPLLDRMEVIDLSGYLMEEKVEIARRHLIPRLLAEHRLNPEDVEISPETISAIIEGYTSESGVRQLEKQLGSLVRKAVLHRVSGKEFPSLMTTEHLTELLGVPTYSHDRYEDSQCPGVVTGLAWTSAGGEILYVESSVTKRSAGESGAGAPPVLTLTGNLGNVMKESATIALHFVMSHSEQLGIDPSAFEGSSVHLHVPEGAIPKDGPSAGIAMATSFASAFSGRKVQPRIAMTGELTLRGRVLPVGGIKEKILAAKRAGIVTIILPKANRKDVGEIPSEYLEGLTFRYVDQAVDAIELVLRAQ